jgi:hypothetical protein
VHGLYDLAWSTPLGAPDFLNEYKAYYRSQSEWNQLLGEFGFEVINGSSSPEGRAQPTSSNLLYAYYSVYQPVKDSKKMKCVSVVNQPSSTLECLKVHEIMVDTRRHGLSSFVDKNL